ncbi:MAG: hypothetical protein RIQ38_858 [Pseudomonadota bacterium]|jgi:surfeit locus 1 family protein
MKRRWLVLVATLIGMAITASMGVWQLGRGQTKLALQAQREARALMPVLDGATLAQPLDEAAREALLERRVLLRGRWRSEASVFLENRQMNGRPGFYVLTPLEIEAPGRPLARVMVQRGWVPRSFTDRTALPPIPTPQETVQIEGRISPWPSRLYDFDGPAQGAIRQNLDWAAWQQETGWSFPHLSVLQTGADGDGLMRQWPAVASGVDKHWGYAFQWFGLCALMALLYVWFQIVQPRTKRKRGAAGSDGA